MERVREKGILRCTRHLLAPGRNPEENPGSLATAHRSPRNQFVGHALGFRLDSGKEIDVFRGQSQPPRHKVDDFFEYGRALVRTLMNAQSSQHLHSDDWHRTVYIDTLGVGTTEFDLTQVRKNALVEEGRTCTEAYLEWFEAEGERSWNQPGNEPED